ncbi:MAG: hypothetical protein AAF824_16445 [Bacteroidota bacterium]
MRIFELETVFPQGKYKGKTLENTFDEDPTFIEDCLLNDKTFLLAERALREMKKLNPEFAFSMDALESNDVKWTRYDLQRDNVFLETPLAEDIEEDIDFDNLDAFEDFDVF